MAILKTDLDLTTKDLAGLTSPDALTAFLSRLGYETSRRIVLTPSALGLSVDTASVDPLDRTLVGGCGRVSESGGRSAVGRRVRDLLQHGAVTQRDRLCHAGRQAGRSCRGHLGRAEREAGDGRRPAASQGRGERNCPATVERGTLRRPGRRIGQRGDATRAPTQGPRPDRAARCRPTASRDWPESDKSIHSFCSH